MATKERTATALDYDGNTVTLHVGDVVYAAQAVVDSPASFRKEQASWARVREDRVLAISPSGQVAFGTAGSRPHYEKPPRLIVTLEQAKRYMLERTREKAALLAEEAARAKALVSALVRAPETIDGLTFDIHHEPLDLDTIAATAREIIS